MNEHALAILYFKILLITTKLHNLQNFTKHLENYSVPLLVFSFLISWFSILIIGLNLTFLTDDEPTA